MGIRSELASAVEFFVSWFPGASGYRIRRWFLGRRLNCLGEGANIGVGLQIIGSKNITIGEEFSCWRHCTLAACEDGSIEIGDRVKLNANVYINACNGGRIVLGNDVLIAPNVVMRASDHVTTHADIVIAEQGHTPGEIIVEDDVWLGSNVTVVGGVLIGRGAVIAAGSLVTRDVKPYTVVAGVPARFAKKRGAHNPEENEIIETERAAKRVTQS